MITRAWTVIPFLLLITASVKIFAADKPETPHRAFVTEYVRELAAFEDVRASAQKEVIGTKGNDRFSSAVHGMTLIQLEL